jgi:hypothetical protein
MEEYTIFLLGLMFDPALLPTGSVWGGAEIVRVEKIRDRILYRPCLQVTEPEIFLSL